MRRFSALLLVAASACVVKLDHEFDAPPESTPGDTPVASGCRVLPGVALTGDLRSIASDVTVDFLDDRGNGYAAAAPRADCGWNTRALGKIVAASPIRADAIVSPLDLVRSDSGVALYYAVYVPDSSAAFGVRSIGVGVALGPDGGPFAPTSELLWSADRATYGTSALREGDRVYAYGCFDTAPLVVDCYVARAPASSLANAAAYEYFDGAAWSTNPDDARSIAKAGTSISVRRDGDRFVMTFVPPLGRTIQARTAIAPEGPWSSPSTLATCDLSGAGADAFCGGATQHAIAGLAPHAIALTYSARSFAGARGEAFAPRLVVLPVP